MSSKIALGFGYFRGADDKIPRLSSNFLVPDHILEAMYRYRVDTGASLGRQGVVAAACSPLFNRESDLRYFPVSGLHMDGYNACHGYSYNGLQDYLLQTTTADHLRRRLYEQQPITTGYQPYAIASVAVLWQGNTDSSNYLYASAYANGDPPYLPDKKWGFPALTMVDIPGTLIGRVFKHPVATTQIFNAIGEIATSQGDIVLGGVYAPDENILHHMLVRVYFTKSGGTGTPTGTSGTAGSVSTGSDEFTEAGKFGSAVVDQYIVVRNASNPINNGAFRITSVAGAPNSVTVDATAINQPFVTETGGAGGSEMTWELRDGPVGEYFWQGRPYFFDDNWGNTMHNTTCGNLPLFAQAHEWGNNATEARYMDFCVTQHDRGAFWYMIFNHPTDDGDYGLGRWRSMSPDMYDPVYANGRITGAPTGAYDWRDIIIDDRDYLVTCWAGHADDTKHLMVFDPHPNGDSSAPESKGVYGKQSNAYTADGFTSAALAGLVADDSEAYTAGIRIWVFSENDGSGGDGGISYTDDYFTTIKRIHKLQTVTGTDTFNALGTSITRVSGSTDLTTVFAEGDWVTVQDDTRAYEITGVAADTLTTATTVNTLSGKTIQKGALTDAQARLFYQTDPTTNTANSNFAVHPPCDYDSQGNIYWIPDGQDRVCKWDPSAGTVSEITLTQLSATYTAQDPSTLVVSRVPDIAGSGSSIWNDNIWIGFEGTTYGGWARIYGGSFDGTHTRYNHNVADNFPTSVDTGSIQGFSIYPGWYTLVEPHTGQIHLLHPGNEPIEYGWGAIHTYDGSSFSSGQNRGPYSSDGQRKFSAAAYAAYDDLGMGMAASFPCGRHLMYVAYGQVGWQNANAVGGWLMGPTWLPRRWNGTEWVIGPLNQVDTNIDFAGAEVSPGPYVENVPTEWVGSGTKRLHEDDQLLVHGVTIRFEDAGSPTAQESEFVIDETATSVFYIGAGKDNISEAEWGVDVYGSPTVYRLNEPVKSLANLWTTDGGIDGGHLYLDVDLDSVVPFQRGPAEIFEKDGTGYDPYWDTDGFTANSEGQYLAALRIKDEDLGSGSLEKSDGEALAGLTQFKSASTTFSTSMEGMTLIIEGSGAGNNGQRIITSANGTDTVTVSPALANTETSVRFKVRDIPAVGYVCLVFDYCAWRTRSGILNGTEFTLRSSRDYGQTWTTEKIIGGNFNTMNADVSMDDTCFINASEFVDQYNTNTAGGSTVFFDLTDKITADEHSTKRQYWKIVQDLIYGYGDAVRPAGIVLFDQYFNILGRTSTNKIEDADDDLFVACLVGAPMLVPHEGTVSGYATDDNDGDDFTPYFDAPGENFYEASGLNGSLTGATSVLTDASNPFLRTHEGMYIRIHDATNTENNGFHPITAFTDAGTITLGSTGLVTETGLDWEICKFGEGDYLRVVDSSYLAYTGAPLSDVYYLISDIPAANRIQLYRDELPVTLPVLTTSGVAFDINRIPTGATEWDTTQYDGFDSSGGFAYSAGFGTLYYGEALEFIEIDSGVTAWSYEWTDGTYSGDDTDGDGMVNAVIVSGVAMPADVAVGDFLLIESSSFGRRVLEIADFSISGDHTDFKLYYDEVWPNESFSLWKVLTRRDWMKSAMRRTAVVLNENE